LFFGLLWYGLGTEPTAVPFFRISGATMLARTGIPLESTTQLRGSALAVSDADAHGRFYFLAQQQDARSPHRIIHLVTITANGQIDSSVPFRRLDGRPIGHYCDHFSVSQSGDLRWTARSAYEDKQRGTIITAYDAKCNPIQEWRLPLGPGSIAIFRAIGERQADLYGMDGQRYRFTVGETMSRVVFTQRHIPEYLSANGDAWAIRPIAGEHEHTVYGLYHTDLTGEERRLAEVHGFTIHERLLPFAYVPPQHLYCSLEQPYRKEDPQKFRHKAVYQVSTDGTVQRLFSTDEVLPRWHGRHVKVGQMLHVNTAGNAWFVIEYAGDGDKREFQIVKTGLHPRWEIWRYSLLTWIRR
jgi:hypothetical protein